MSIYNAMYSGISGLMAEDDALGVIGNNLANTNTVGFKESRAVFESVLGGAVGQEGAIGGGVTMATAQQIFAQGSMQQTGQPTDAAIQGDGFFVVNGNVGGINGDFYTRAGETTLSANGTLVNPDGLAFQGYMSNGDGTFSSTLGDIQVSTAAIPPEASKTLTVTANLSSADTPPAVSPFDPQNPANTSNFSTSMTVYDSLGAAHNVSIYYTNTAPGQWTYHVLAPSADVGGTGSNTEIGTGTLNFDASGALASETGTTSTSVTFNGAKPQTLTLDFGTPTSSGGTGTDGMTGYGSADALSSQSADGYASGALSSLQLDSTGVLSGVYSNGQTLAIGQLAVAKFQSNTGLGQAGQSLWTATSDSGQAAVGQAGSGGRGSLVSGSLEASNVDIATQFTDLIAHQTGFQADSKTITTADQMLNTLIGMVQG